ncbi:MAG: hypothetical protein A2854_03720 [Parcubacteria group bacterium RIFCSPHIGHO2_01_FULL_56_18]|nr:MAG: hypothetical protein A2854_03720 [Parcubacteria group bacterium RIFCSPHIGHO2_01_FULL_56_18]
MIKQLVARSQQLVARIRKHSEPSLLPAPQRGFTILLAALVASLVLTLGIAIFSVAQKQVILSSLGRSSQYAFYAADTGAECALYWDVRFDYFSSTTPAGTTPACDGTALVFTGTPGALPYTMSFEFEPNEYCSQVSVVKSATHPRTVIHADGFSTPCSDISISGRALQRSVELSY